MTDRDPDRKRDPSQPDSEQTTRTSQTSSPEQGRIGPYRILEQVGAGGMGEVYRAEQTEPIRRTVALKVIKRGMDTKEVVTRFEAERQALALMDHPNIAKVFDAGSTPEGRPYFAMEYVKGVPITTHCDEHKLSVRERLELFIQLCEGVQHAHQKAIIHRDLKPSNVLVTIQNDKPVPKIIDFGVAKATAQDLTEKTMYTALGELIGTPEYMSPEQAAMTGQDVDTRTDVYALGVILYELLVGALPFEPTALRRAGFEGIVRMIREQDPPRPSARLGTLGDRGTDVAKARRTIPGKLTSRLRGDLDWITMRALEKNRMRRYGSAAELAADVRRHLGDEPVLASPPSTAYRLRKFVRRHRVAVATSSVVAASLIVAAVVSAFFALSEARQRQSAAQERDRANMEAERANQESEAAQEVTNFLVGLFDASDPRITLGEVITAREIMDLGATRLEEGDVGQAPLLQARLLGTMGRVYQNQGVYDRAGELLEKELAVRRHEQGDEHPDVARTLGRLGWLRGAYQRNLAAARRHLLEAVSIQEEAFGHDHIETAWSLYYLGSALSFGQDPCGIDYLERARLVFEDTLGAESLPVSWCWNDLGKAFWDGGEYHRALECNLRAVKIKERLLPPDDPDIATSRYGAGDLLVKLGRCEEAEPLLEQALRSVVQTLGWDHDHTALFLLAVATLHRCLGDFDEARRHATRATGIMVEAQGGDHELYALALHEQGLIALETGQDSEADSLLQEADNLMRKTVGHDSPGMAHFLSDRAAVLRKIGRESSATAVEERVQAIRGRWRQQRERCSHR